MKRPNVSLPWPTKFLTRLRGYTVWEPTNYSYSWPTKEDYDAWKKQVKKGEQEYENEYHLLPP